MLSGDITKKKFATTKWREGYQMDQVDALLERVRATLIGYEHRRRPTDAITATEVAESRFIRTKFRSGYDQDQVDDFLDELVAALRKHEAR